MGKVSVFFSSLQHTTPQAHVGSPLAVPRGTHDSRGQGQGSGTVWPIRASLISFPATDTGNLFVWSGCLKQV